MLYPPFGVFNLNGLWFQKTIEIPQEVVNLLELWSASKDLVNNIFHACHTAFGQVLLNNEVGGKSESLAADLSVPSLVEQRFDGLSVWESKFFQKKTRIKTQFKKIELLRRIPTLETKGYPIDSHLLSKYIRGWPYT